MLLQILLPVIDTVAILFMGDVMQHREQLLSAHICGEDTVLSRSYDYSSYFKHIRRLTEAADFAVANMEFTLGGAPYSGYPAFSAPESLPQEALDAGIDLFLCANNHICDRGAKGLQRSMEQYEKMNADITGIYKDSLDEAEHNPYMVEIKGIRTAFINFTFGTNGIKVPSPYIVNMMEKEKVARAIERAEERGADIIVALPHWGEEYDTLPTPEQRRWNDFLLERGVDAVVGSHPHVVQPTETILNEERGMQVTIFSMGNLISNMSLENTESGAIFILKIVKTFNRAHIAGCETIPVWCSRKGGLEKGYTVIPVKEYLEKESSFQNRWNYVKMKNSYNRLKALYNERKRDNHKY